MKIDKRNGAVCFSEETHTYWNENGNGKYIYHYTNLQCGTIHRALLAKRNVSDVLRLNRVYVG